MKCPCCGGEVDDLPLENLLEAPWSPIEKTIMRRIVKQHPTGARLDQLIMDIYGSRNDQPEFAETSFHVLMLRLRKKLAGFGWQIPKARGCRDMTYRLVKL